MMVRMARPRNRDYDELRRALIDAAGRVLSTEGPAALSTRRVAQLAGVSTTAVYSLFGDKGGLVREMFLAGFARLADAFAKIPATEDPVVDLRALGRAYRENALTNPHLYELMFGRPVPEFRPDEAASAEIRPTFDALVAAVDRCIDEGAFAPADPYEVAVGLNGLVHGMCSLELRGALGDRTEADRLWDRALETMLKGLSA